MGNFSEIRVTADWILHIKLAAVLVLLACCCNPATNEADGGMSRSALVSSSDPFASFTPDLFTSIEKNDTFNEVIFSGIINNLNVEERYCEDLQDTLRFVNSGIEGVNPFLSISRRIILPERARKLELSLPLRLLAVLKAVRTMISTQPLGLGVKSRKVPTTSI